MKATTVVLTAVTAAFLILSAGFVAGRRSESPVSDSEDTGARKIKYWTCSMHPQVRRDGPGICPLCPMELIEKYEDEDRDPGERRLSMSEEAAALADIETARVERRFVSEPARRAT